MAKVLPIAQLGAPVIRKIAEPVTDLNSEETQNFIDDLMLTCSDAQGMGTTTGCIDRGDR